MSTAILVVPSAMHASPSIRLHTQYYPISGTDIPTIYQSLQRDGPSGRLGRNYHAHTEWDIKWSYRWIESAGQCRLTHVDVSIEISYLLPKLQTYSALNARIKHSWDRYYKALTEHEAHHKDLGIKAAQELEQVLLTTQPQSCFGLKNSLSERAEQVIAKYDALEKQYDRDTNHGANEGVVLE